MSVRQEAPVWLVGPSVGLDVWALEPYFGGSHQRFLEGLAHHSSHRFRLLTLPGRDWKWRMHGAAVTMAREASDLLRATDVAPTSDVVPTPDVVPTSEAAACGRQTIPGPQVVFASDMLDLATFKALAPPPVATAPAILYMHENQLSYPLPPGVDRDLGYGFTNITSALAADRVYFNSAFHRHEFLAAVRDLFAGLPDAVPTWALDELEARSDVLPLGCDLRWLDQYRPDVRPASVSGGRWGERADGPLILWNQRWEYDKAPGELFRALYGLQERGVSFRLALAGANHGVPTAEFVEARERLAREIVQWGRVEAAADYASLLWESDVVVSTALHEFFGVSVVEALYCGCHPVLPDRLSYREIIPEEAQSQALYPNGGLVPALMGAIERTAPSGTPGSASPAWSIEWQRTWVSRYDWSAMVSRYDSVVRECWEAGRHRLGTPAG